MKAEERNVSQILTGKLRYEIPPYQRPYSWGPEQTQDLLQDLEDAFSGNEREYFIGSVITIERVTNELYEVVDGQQRLTTLSILFCKLRDAIEAADARQHIGETVLPRNPLTGQTETPRLSLRQRDQNFFRTFILEPDGASRNVPTELDTPKRNLIKNAEVIRTHLAKHNQQWLKLFADFILNNVYVVVVKTGNFDSAYRLFNVLNARGLSLSNADLIKNQLFSTLPRNDNRQTDLEQFWVELEEITQTENLDTFLSYHRTALKADKARKSLAEEFEPLIKTDPPSPFEFLRGLVQSARNYDRVISNEFDEPRALRCLDALKRVTYDEWVPALLAFLNCPVKDMKESEYLSFLERITMQNWVRRLGRTARNTIYYRLISAINKGEDAESIRSIFRDSANNDEFFALLSGDVYGMPGAQAILLRLEEGSQDDSVTKTYGGRLTIEHVLPQALKDEYWVARFDVETHNQWLHKLGNITLLSGTKNTKAQYFAFPKKKDIYRKRSDRVSFDLTKEICQSEEWGAEEITIRQAKLIDTAKEIWAIT